MQLKIKKSYEKQKATDPEKTLKIKARNMKQSYEKQKAIDPGKTLRDKARNKKKSSAKLKANDPVKFSKEDAAKNKKSYEKLKATNQEKFLKNRASKKKQNEDKLRASSFLTSKQKSDLNLKAKSLRLFKKAQCDRRQRCNDSKNRSIDAQERLRRFENQVRFGPIFVCRCCKRKLFQHQVKEEDIESFKTNVEAKNKGIFSNTQ